MSAASAWRALWDRRQTSQIRTRDSEPALPRAARRAHRGSVAADVARGGATTSAHEERAMPPTFCPQLRNHPHHKGRWRTRTRRLSGRCVRLHRLRQLLDRLLRRRNAGRCGTAGAAWLEPRQGLVADTRRLRRARRAHRRGRRARDPGGSGRRGHSARRDRLSPLDRRFGRWSQARTSTSSSASTSSAAM